MRILITGASGYIGGWLCRFLSEEGHELVGFSRTAGNQQFARAWYQGEITDLAALSQAAADCEAVVHLAALPQHRSEAAPMQDLQVNALGALQALTAAQSASVRRFVLLSSSAVYGAARGCLPEEAPLLPITPYGVSKAAAEAYGGLFARTFHLPVVILRLFNVYGPAVDGSVRPTVESRFLRAVRMGQAPVIRGEPRRVYDFIHTADAIRGISLALRADLAPGTVLNLGSGQPVALLDLARWHLEAAGLALEPVLQPDVGIFTSSYADLTRTRQLLGFSPRVDMHRWVQGQLTE